MISTAAQLSLLHIACWYEMMRKQSVRSTSQVFLIDEIDQYTGGSPGNLRSRKTRPRLKAIKLARQKMDVEAACCG